MGVGGGGGGAGCVGGGGLGIHRLIPHTSHKCSNSERHFVSLNMNPLSHRRQSLRWASGFPSLRLGVLLSRASTPGLVQCPGCLCRHGGRLDLHRQQRRPGCSLYHHGHGRGEYDRGYPVLGRLVTYVVAMAHRYGNTSVH